MPVYASKTEGNNNRFVGRREKDGEKRQREEAQNVRAKAQFVYECVLCVCECVHACGGMREMSKKNDNGEESEEIRNGSCMNS